jgi:hypothetical protein
LVIGDRNRRRSPPYVSYRSFLTLLEELQRGVPARIDRSYWEDKFSGSTGTQLMSALRFLGLIDANHVPTALLKDLVSSKGTERSGVLRKVCHDSYSFLMSNSFDPQTATYAQVEEVFVELYQVEKDVCRKCIKFFIELSNDASIPLSPFITKKTKSSRQGTSYEKVPKKSSARTSQNVKVPNQQNVVPGQTSWKELLLSKFPSFDPNWPTDVQIKWFEAFDELLKRGFVSGNDR